MTIDGNQADWEREDHASASSSVLDAVQQVNRTLRDGSSEEVLQLVASSARKALEADVAAVTSTEPGDIVVVRAADGLQASELTGVRLPAEHVLARRTVQSSEPHVIDLRQQEAYLASVTHCDLETALCVPLIRERRRVGAVHFGRCRDRPPFTDDDLRTAGMFAAPALIAVEQAHARELLQRFGNAPSPSDTALREALDGLCEQVIGTFGARASTIYLLDPDSQLWIAAHRGTPDPVPPHELRRNEHPVWRAISTGLAVVHHPDIGNTWAEQLRGWLRPDRERALVCVPIMWQSDTYGALSCSFASSRHAERQVRFLNLIAGQLAWMTDHARLLILAQQKVVEEERHRLARELHDTVSQVLYGIALGARTAQELSGTGDTDRLTQPIEYVLQLAQAGLSEMRALISALRSDSLESEGLVALLGKEVEALRARHGLTVEAALDEEPATSKEAKQVAYRIGKEALQNVARHARARRLWVRLHAADGELVLEIADDGVGFDPNAGFPGHLGLRSMRERVREVGGSIEVDSEPGKGTRIRARIPGNPPENGS